MLLVEAVRDTVPGAVDKVSVLAPVVIIPLVSVSTFVTVVFNPSVKPALLLRVRL